MPSPDTAPRTVEAWLQQLDAVQLPIQQEEQVLLLRALADERLSLREVVTQMQRCPSFVLLVIREANRGRNEPIASLEMAVRRLGLSRTAGLLRDMQPRATGEIGQALRQLQLVSLHAAQQAEGLFGARLARLGSEIHLASLLFLAPLWPLAERYPELFNQWVQRVLINSERAQQVEQALFGVPLRWLSLALAEHWRLPEWIESGLRLLGRDRRRLVQALHVAHDNQHPLQQQQRLDETPALRRWLTQPANTILLANGIAIAAHSGWDGSHTLRWQRLAGLYLNLPLEIVQQQVHQQAVISARQHTQPDLWHPAQMLVRSGSRSARPKERAFVLDEPAWRRHCERLGQPGAFRNAVQLFDCARDALAACGLERLLLLVANRSHSQLLIQQSHGLLPLPTNAPIACADSEILRRLLQRPARLALGRDNFARWAPLLPNELTALFRQPPLLLQSLASDERVRMILIAEVPDSAAHPQLHEHLAQTLRSVEQGMAQLLAPPAGKH